MRLGSTRLWKKEEFLIVVPAVVLQHLEHGGSIGGAELSSQSALCLLVNFESLIDGKHSNVT